MLAKSTEKETSGTASEVLKSCADMEFSAADSKVVDDSSADKKQIPIGNFSEAVTSFLGPGILAKTTNAICNTKDFVMKS